MTTWYGWSSYCLFLCIAVKKILRSYFQPSLTSSKFWEIDQTYAPVDRDCTPLRTAASTSHVTPLMQRYVPTDLCCRSILYAQVLYGIEYITMRNRKYPSY